MVYVIPPCCISRADDGGHQGDELSMLIATATVLHRVYTFDRTLPITVWSGITLTVALSAFSVWHCITDELVMHSVIFGIMICLVGIKTRSIIAARIPDPSVRKEVKRLATWGAIIFVSGFGIWNVDNFICGFLTDTKRELGMPWSFVLELHGWWHIFTGMGAYICQSHVPASFRVLNLGRSDADPK
jgi:dihydroceramidase